MEDLPGFISFFDWDIRDTIYLYDELINRAWNEIFRQSCLKTGKQQLFLQFSLNK